MQKKNMLQLFGFEFLMVSESVLVLLSYWLVFTSFYEADWWHFTDPQATGISIPALIVFALCLFISPLLMCFKTIRQLQLNVVCKLLLKLLPSALLATSAMPFLNTISWARTSLLGFGVILAPLSITWFMPRLHTTESKSQSSSPFENKVDLQHLYLIDSFAKLSRDKLIFIPDGLHFLLAILISMSIRYCTGTINVFYENWVFSLCLFFIIMFLSVLNLVLFEVKILEIFSKHLRSRQSTESSIIGSQDLDSSSNRNITELATKKRIDQDTNTSNNRNESVHKVENTTNGFDEDSYSCNSTFPKYKPTGLFAFFGCFHGFALGVLLELFLWLFSTPNLLWSWSGLNRYNNGVFIIFAFLIGFIGLLMMTPDRLCHSLSSSNSISRNKKSIGVLGLVAAMLISLLLVGTAFLLQSEAISFIGSLILCIFLPFVFSINVYSIYCTLLLVSSQSHQRCISALPGLCALLSAFGLLLGHLVFVSFINPQVTLIFLGRIDIILILILALFCLQIVAFVIGFKLVNMRFTNLKITSTKEKSLGWLDKAHRELIEKKRLVILGILAVIISIISASIGPQFKARQCSSFEPAISDLTAATKSLNENNVSSFSVLSWNILLGHDIYGKDNLACVGKALEVIQPDVVGLQETGALPPYWGGKDIATFLSGYLQISSYPGVNPREGSLGVDLLSKLRVVEHQSFLLPTDEQEKLPRYSLVKIVCKFQDQAIQIFNVHAVYKNWTASENNLSPFANVSSEQINFIAQKVKESPENMSTIVMGDFNLNLFEPELDILYDIGFKNAHHEIRDDSGPSTINNRFSVIDHVFYKDLVLVEARTLNQTSFISDHYPVVALFKLPI